jgi:hypothetical protein
MRSRLCWYRKTNRKLLVIKYRLQYLWGHSSPLGLPAYFVYHVFQGPSIGCGDLFQPKTKQCFHFSLFFCRRRVEYSSRFTVYLYLIASVAIACS